LRNKYLLCDRDGTLIKHVPYLHLIEQVEISPGVIPVLKIASQLNFRFGILSNQSVIGRGFASRKEVDRVNAFVSLELSRLGNIYFDFIYYCPHVPEDKCMCRKPEIGMIQDDLSAGRISISESFMIGDQETDVLFGKNIGVKTVLISETEGIETQADYIVQDFLAIESLLRRHS